MRKSHEPADSSNRLIETTSTINNTEKMENQQPQEKRTLNSIVMRHHLAEELLFDAGGELTVEIIELIEDNETALKDKLDAYTEWIGYCKGQAEYLKGLAEEYTKRAKTMINASDSARERVLQAMIELGETKVKTLKHNYSVRVTDSWKVKDDINNLTQKYLVSNKLAEFVFKPSISAIKEFNKGFDVPEYIEVTSKNSLTIRLAATKG